MAEAPPPRFDEATSQSRPSQTTIPLSQVYQQAHESNQQKVVNSSTEQATEDCLDAPKGIVLQPKGLIPAGERGRRFSFHEDLPILRVDKDVADKGCCAAKLKTLKRRNCYYLRVIFSTLAHLGFLVGIIGLILSFVLDSVSEHRTNFIITAGVCYGVLWLETWCSDDLSFLCNIKSPEEFKEHMSDMHQQTPEISMKVVCYHFQSDSPGGSSRTVTHKEKMTFEYSLCRDTAPPNIILDGSRPMRVTFDMTWHFADVATKAAYDNQYQALQARNRYRDRVMDSFEKCKLPGFKKRMLVYMNPANNHPCFQPCVYICLSWFVLTWPYRWWFKSKTARTSYTFDKEIGL